MFRGTVFSGHCIEIYISITVEEVQIVMGN